MTEGSRRLLRLLFAVDAQHVRDAAPTSDRGWEELADRCLALGASGLAHAALRRTQTTDLAPRETRAALRIAHAANVAQNVMLLAEANRALDALRAAGARVAPMKGVALFTEGIVDDLGTRPTADVDVVASRADIALVLSTLGALGFVARHDVASWKHLPAMWRGDVSIEVHDIAYFSASSRAVFGATHLAVAHRPTRLGRLAAMQLHHLVLGSPPDAGLLVRTLADLDAFLALAARDPEVMRAMKDAADDAGLLRELVATDAVLAGARGVSTRLGLPDRAADRAALLAPLDADADDPRIAMLRHAWRVLPVQPWEVTWQMLNVLLFPTAERVAATSAPGVGRGALWTGRAKRPLELFVRVLRALPATLSARARRPGRDAP